jgi:hypothetical protein
MDRGDLAGGVGQPKSVESVVFPLGVTGTGEKALYQLAALESTVSGTIGGLRLSG